MKRVLYLLTSPSHKRVFESFVERSDIQQMIVGPAPISSNSVVTEDYSAFKIKDIKYYKSNSQLQNIIKQYKPHIIAQASLPIMRGNFKRVYVSHGLVGNHVTTLNLDNKAWIGCDLYCGAWNSIFSDWVRYAAGAKNNILLDALPQLDILYSEKYKDNKLKFLQHTHPRHNPNSKVILFLGFCCKDRVDFKKHNEDFIATTIALSEYSKSNDVLVYIKPRQEQFKIKEFLQKSGLEKKYGKDYKQCFDNDRLYFIGPTHNHILDYYFADLFVVNGCSTSEVEAAALQKPLFVVRTKQNMSHGYDPYNTVTSGAAVEVNNISVLATYLNECLYHGKHHEPHKQRKLLQEMGISFDGKMHKRIQDKLVTL